MNAIFEKGARWTHKNLGFEVYLCEVADSDTFRLAYVEPDSNALANSLISGYWKTMDLVRSFAPRYNPSIWDRLLQGDFLNDFTP